MTNSYVKTLVLILMTSIMIGCGGTTKDEDKSDNTSIESLLSSGVLSGTTTRTMDNKSTDVKVSKSNGTYKVEYPSLACKGTLEVISTSATEMIFKINFTEGSCQSGTKLKLTNMGNNQVAINEYASSTEVGTTLDANTNSSVRYDSFMLQDGRFTSSPSNSSASNIILSVSHSGKDIIADYPNAHCNSRWISIQSPSLNAIRYKESITYGTCTNNLIVEVRKNSRYGKQVEVTFFKPDGVTRVDYNSNIYHYGSETLYYHNDQASFATQTISSQFTIKKSYSQYGNFILNDGRATSSPNNSSSSNIILNSYNNGKDILVDYPNAHCNSKWISIQSPSLNAIRFRETITYGTCTNNLIVEVRKNSRYDKQVEVTFFKPDGVAKVDYDSNIYHYGSETLYNFNDQVSTATLDAGTNTQVTQEENIQNASISESTTSTNTYTSQNTPINTGFISTYSHGGFFKITDGNLARYAADGTYEALIVSNVNSIIPLPKGKVMVLRTADKIQVIDYIDPPFEVLYSTLSDLDSIQGGRYSNGVVYLGSRSIDVSEYVY